MKPLSNAVGLSVRCTVLNRVRRRAICLVWWLLACGGLTAASGPFALDLPVEAVSAQVMQAFKMAPNETRIGASFDGPGCIRQMWIVQGGHPTLGKNPPLRNRKVIIRIYFDDAKAPQVEAPLGDFFGMMHGLDYYPVNTPLVSTKEANGYNCFFEMPFARGARIEFVNGPNETSLHLMVAWQRFPDQEMKEKRRFCAQWRREMPTERYGENYLILDAVGRGQLIGFFYGVRLLDNTDRWSHGGAENIFIDGLGRRPSYIRGLGGEDTFGTSYGGVLHTPETHLYSGIPYYKAEDVGEARSANRLVGYRFYLPDPIAFNESIRFEFGCMSNDICSMVYWYQEGEPRRFASCPDWGLMEPGVELRRGKMDLALPADASWVVGPLLDNKGNAAIKQALQAKGAQRPSDRASWIRTDARHGFVNFNRVHRPKVFGVGTHYVGQALEAVSYVEVAADMTARVRLGWDDHLVLRVNSGAAVDLGNQSDFREKVVEVQLKRGRNQVSVVLSNERSNNNGGWAFSFSATAPDGKILTPNSAAAESGAAAPTGGK
jgi:hypothetical protein